ncbi:MAG: hypothetical protein RL272_191 [Candidatus Parcubacteria bacterium]|jgi:methylphosphotriester-DNA--protein-cysteine methyltransferase
MSKRYLVMKDGAPVESPVPGRYAGWKGGKIFGRLSCQSGRSRMRPENRVFFLTWEDALAAGYRPCKNCRPSRDDRYIRLGGRWRLRAAAG